MEQTTINPKDESQFSDLNASEFEDDRGAESEYEGVEGNSINDEIVMEQEFEKEFEDPTSSLIPEEEDEPLPTEETTEETTQDETEESTTDELSFSDDEFEEALTGDEKKELEDLNKLLGTDYKDLNELKSLIHNQEQEPVNEEIKQLKAADEYYDSMLNQWSDEQVVFNDKVIKANQEGRKLTDDEMIELKEEVSEMDNIDLYARTIRAENMLNAKDVKSRLDNYTKEQKQSEQQKIDQRNQQIKDVVLEYSTEKKFYGLPLTKENLLKAYNVTSKNKMIEQLSNDPKLQVEVQLFLQKREDFKKLSNTASYSDGVEATLNAIKGKQPSTPDKGRNTKNKVYKDHMSFIADFIK